MRFERRARDWGRWAHPLAQPAFCGVLFVESARFPPGQQVGGLIQVELEFNVTRSAPSVNRAQWYRRALWDHPFELPSNIQSVPWVNPLQLYRAAQHTCTYPLHALQAGRRSGQSGNQGVRLGHRRAGWEAHLE